MSVRAERVFPKDLLAGDLVGSPAWKFEWPGFYFFGLPFGVISRIRVAVFSAFSTV